MQDCAFWQTAMDSNHKHAKKTSGSKYYPPLLFSSPSSHSEGGCFHRGAGTARRGQAPQRVAAAQNKCHANSLEVKPLLLPQPQAPAAGTSFPPARTAGQLGVTAAQGWQTATLGITRLKTYKKYNK